MAVLSFTFDSYLTLGIFKLSRVRIIIAVLVCCLIGAAAIYAGAATQVPPAELQNLYAVMGLKTHNGELLDACDTPVTPETEVTDLNGDGQPEVFVWVGGSCYGAAGGELSLFIKGKKERWEQNLGFSAGGYTLLKTRSHGYPDIEVAGPGVCLPVWRWSGKAYELFKGCDP